MAPPVFFFPKDSEASCNLTLRLAAAALAEHCAARPEPCSIHVTERYLQVVTVYHGDTYFVAWAESPTSLKIDLASEDGGRTFDLADDAFAEQLIDVFERHQRWCLDPQS